MAAIGDEKKDERVFDINKVNEMGEGWIANSNISAGECIFKEKPYSIKGMDRVNLRQDYNKIRRDNEQKKWLRFWFKDQRMYNNEFDKFINQVKNNTFITIKNNKQ